MALFANTEEIGKVIGGFLQRFPDIDPLIKILVGHSPVVLKLELADPELSAEIDLNRSPLEVNFGSNAMGTIGMSGPADNFHRLLLGNLPLSTAINQKKLLVRGSMAKLMKVVPLFYIAPSIYPFYLESTGRSDLITDTDRPALHADVPVEDKMTKLISVIAYIAGYAIGFIKSRISPNLDIIAALESMGKGLLRATNNGLPKSTGPKEK